MRSWENQRERRLFDDAYAQAFLYAAPGDGELGVVKGAKIPIEQVTRRFGAGSFPMGS